MNVNILIVDDCADNLYPLMAMWSDEHQLPVDWKLAMSGREGLATLRTEPVDLVLMDGFMIGEEGHQVVTQMRNAGIATPVVMFSSDEKQNRLGMQAGAEYVVNKKLFFNEDESGFEQQDLLASVITLKVLET